MVYGDKFLMGLNEAASKTSISDFFKSLDNVKVDTKVVRDVEKAYDCWIPSEVARIICKAKKGEFVGNNSRILSLNEILNAEKDLGVKFASKGLVPIADTGNNDFIVYDSKKNNFSKFNITDQVQFKKGACCPSELMESMVREAAPGSTVATNPALVPGMFDASALFEPIYYTFIKYIPSGWHEWGVEITANENPRTKKTSIGVSVYCWDAKHKHMNVPKSSNLVRSFMNDNIALANTVQGMYSKTSPKYRFSKLGISYTIVNGEVNVHGEFEYPD